MTLIKARYTHTTRVHGPSTRVVWTDTREDGRPCNFTAVKNVEQEHGREHGTYWREQIGLRGGGRWKRQIGNGKAAKGGTVSAGMENARLANIIRLYYYFYAHWYFIPRGLEINKV